MNLQGILERLDAGEVVVGDGGYVMQLERRGYVKAGHWTPEAAVEHPEAGRKMLCSVQLQRGRRGRFYTHDKKKPRPCVHQGFSLILHCT